MTPTRTTTDFYGKTAVHAGMVDTRQRECIASHALVYTQQPGHWERLKKSPVAYVEVGTENF